MEILLGPVLMLATAAAAAHSFSFAVSCVPCHQHCARHVRHPLVFCERQCTLLLPSADYKQTAELLLWWIREQSLMMALAGLCRHMDGRPVCRTPSL